MGELSDIQAKSNSMLYEAVGRFLINFANAESTLHDGIRGLLGLSRDKSLIVTGSLRYSDLSKMFRALSADLPDERKVHAFAALDQMGQIADLRNKIMHRGLSISGFLEGQISNKVTAKQPEHVEETSVGLMDLSRCSADLIKIMFDLRWAATGNGEKLRPQPWHYKPAPQRKSLAGPKRDRQKRGTPPQSSPQ